MAQTFNPFSLEGKQVLVTGASAGIGQAIAIACSKMGASVVITGRNVDRLNVTRSLLVGEGHISIIGDLTEEVDVLKILSSIPKLDGIVHCAGIGHRLQTALLSAKKVNKSASVVFVASRAANAPSIGNALYSASKGAIISYAKCLTLELAPRGIRVNCICPAMVWTDLIYKGGLTKEDLEKEQLKYPLKRYGHPDDVANLAIYLLSDAASWMTGSCIDLTGGGE